ncbi:MAG: SdrD B-like domain-containing protein, partial [Phenylobacterium sp.]
LTGATLAHGQACTVTVNVTLITTGTIQNKVPASAITDSQGISNTLPTTTSLSASANIGVTKRFTPTVIKPGDRSRLQITLINPTAQALSNVAATDNLPGGLVVASPPNPSTTCAGATVTGAAGASTVGVTGGALPAAVGGISAICIAEIDVTAAAAGTYDNTIAIGGVTAVLGGNPVSNPAPAPATLQVRSPVAIAKAFNANSVALGASSTLTITLTNPNNVALTGAALLDSLPANVTVALTPNASTTCAGGVVTAAVSATSVQLTGGTIPASGACNLKVDVLSNIAGTYLNTIPAGALATTQGVTNEAPASDTLKIINPPSVSKQFAPTSIPSGGTSTLTIVLGNTNATAATLTADFIDTLPTSPAPIVIAAAPGLTGTCTLGSVTANAGAATVKYANGASIPAGGCTIVVNVTGTTNGVYTNTIPLGALQTNDGPNPQPANATLTISPLGFISGTVFKDNNVTPNGTFEIATDTPIAGVTINLTGTDFGANGVAGGGDDTPVSASTVTDALGNYAFTGLNPGSYTVSEPTQPAGTSNGITTAGAISGGGGGTAGTATGVGTTPSVIGNIVLLKAGAAVASSPGNNFAEVAPSTISGVVFLDQDNNGVQNAADTAIAGVTLQLLQGASVVATTTTDASGAYSFSGLAPGTYAVREPTQPPGTANGQTLAGAVGNGGTAGTPTGAGTVPSQIAGLVLPPGTTSSANNFAEVPAGRQVSGRVFTDANNDGVFNGADTPLSGVTLNLTGNDFNGLPVTATTVTTSDGRYVFTGLPESSAGGYTVTEPNQPSGTSNGQTVAGTTGGLATLPSVAPSAISGIDLRTTNTISANNNFGEIALPPGPPAVATLAGHVYVDANNNGVLEASEVGVAGVTVTLTGTSATGTPVSLTTVTAADGTYSFTGMPPSNAAGYFITETQPTAFTDGKTTVPAGEPGSPTASKPVGPGGPDIIGGVVISSGSNFSGYNFGELPPGGQLAGFVYVDLNDNGVKDAGEPGIAGVTVRLTGKDIDGANVDRLQTTAADGSYSFVGVPVSGLAGYALTETQPAAYLDGKTTFPAGNPGTANAVKPVTANGGDAIVTVVVHANDNFKDYDFGEKGDGSIAGFVYQDLNNNGVKDAGEPGIGGVTVRLTGTDANGLAVNRAAVTGADGAYLFAGLVQSNADGYILTETQPTSFGDGKDSIKAGNPGTPSSAKPVAANGPDVVGAVVLAPHGALTDYDFGEGKSSSSIAGYVYVDANNNGVREAGEAAIPGVTVRLTGTDINGIAVSQTQTTDATGAFLFSVTPSNSAGYALTEIQPSGFNDGKTTLLAGNPGAASSRKPVGVDDQDTIGGIVLPVGAALTDYRFGELAVPQLKPPIVNGYVYLDRNHTRVRPTDGTEAGQAGWTVVLQQNGTMICSTTTDATGFYQFDNLHCPGYEVSGLPIGSGFSITFSKDGDSLPNIPTSGGDRGQVPPTGGQILNITLGPADRVVEQNLPLDPSGVVYNSVTRQPVPGAQVHITGPAGFDVTTHLVGGVAAANQTVGADGLYQFLLQNNFPSGVYTLAVTAPSGFVPAPSTSLPPCSNTLTVGLAFNPALIQATDTAPGLGVTPQANVAACPGLTPGGATTTQYFLSFVITNGGSAPILNNHIPLDPILAGALSVTKTTPMVTVSRGALVPYTITATNTLAVPLAGVSVKDQFPAGFKFRDGTATENGKPVKPVVSGQFITWPTETFAAKQKNSYTVMLVVGSGVGDGDYVNHAFVAGPTGAPISNTAAATVRLVPDPTFDCPDIIGKVFDDKNANGYQDDGEPGIPGVRMATPNGLLVTSDAEGRFHVPCPLIPNQDRGSNFVMKLDERSLPSGFRLTTENPRDVRVTRGKLTKLNFGATIHRVVRVELAGGAFAAGGTDLSPEWKAQIDALPGKLAERPSVVRIAYARGEETPDLAKRRIEAVRRLIDQAWRAGKGRYTLIIEIEGAAP